MSLNALRVCIVGGGHASHALAALLPSRGLRTTWLTTYGDEAARINAGLNEQGHMIANFAPHNHPSGVVTGRPEKVSKDPSEVIPQSNVLVMPLPAFAYNDILDSLKPHLKPGTHVICTPGQGGFDWIARTRLGPELARKVNLISVSPMPFNCRIKEFGKRVEVQEFEEKYDVACTPQKNISEAVEVVKRVIGGEVGSWGNFCTNTLAPLNANIHPQRMHSLLKNYKPGDTFAEPPLFYEGMDSESGDLMHSTSDEVQEIAKVLRSKGLDVNPPTIYDYEKDSFYRPGLNRVNELFSNSPGYKGFRAPFKKREDGRFEPDFNNRYFTEDVPYSLVVWKGIAELAGVKTPTIDMLIEWCQGHMKKEYLVNGKLTGKDVKSTSAPQAYGMDTFAKFLNVIKDE